MINTPQKKNYTIRSVSHAIDLLEQFYGDEVELGVTDLSRRTRLPKNKVFRLLATFKSRNYIEQNQETDNYRLGYKSMELGQTFIRQMRRLDRSRPVMEAVVKECNETVCLSVMKDFDTVVLDAVESDQPLRVIPQIGVRIPAPHTAAGRVQIAHVAQEKLKIHLAQHKFQRHTPHSIVNLKQFIAQLELVVKQGYAVEREELDLGVVSIAAPIRDYTASIIGAISCQGPAQRFTEERLKKKLIPLITKSAAEISSRLGYF